VAQYSTFDSYERQGIIKWKLYTPRLLHALDKDNPDYRLQFCEWLFSLCNGSRFDGSGFPDFATWSDEVSIKLSGNINQHNCVHWATEL
jgi:hypothetical protein